MWSWDDLIDGDRACQECGTPFMVTNPTQPVARQPKASRPQGIQASEEVLGVTPPAVVVIDGSLLSTSEKLLAEGLKQAPENRDAILRDLKLSGARLKEFNSICGWKADAPAPAGQTTLGKLNAHHGKIKHEEQMLNGQKVKMLNLGKQLEACHEKAQEHEANLDKLTSEFDELTLFQAKQQTNSGSAAGARIIDLITRSIGPHPYCRTSA